MLLSKARVLAPAALVAALLWGCAGMKISPAGPARPEAEGRAAVAGLVETYQDQRAEAFFKRLDEDNFPNYEVFRNDVRQFLLHVRQISMQVVAGRVLASGSEVSVDADWNRSYVDESGTSKLEKGTCSFIFRRDPNGRLLLAAIQGQSPF
jgi:hypothetical protein